jgi:hypothetical protein
LLRKRRSPDSRILSVDHEVQNGLMHSLYTLRAPHRPQAKIKVTRYRVQVRTLSQMEIVRVPIGKEGESILKLVRQFKDYDYRLLLI